MDNQQSEFRYPSIEMRKGPDRSIWLIIGLTVIIILGILFFSRNNQQSKIQPTSTPQVTVTQQVTSPSATLALTLGKKTKTLGCVSINGLPDKACTPGEIDPKVTQDNIQQTICASGYTKTVRPPVSYTEPLKLKVMQEYGDTDSPKNYELDHLIPLELGGNPTSEANLWPEPYNITLNAHEKDKVENYLHNQVCSGKITLQQTQLQIAHNWEEIYKNLP